MIRHKIVVISDNDEVKLGDINKIDEFHINLLRSYVNEKYPDDEFFNKADKMSIDYLAEGLAYLTNSVVILNTISLKKETNLACFILPSEIDEGMINKIKYYLKRFDTCDISKVYLENNTLKVISKNSSNYEAAENVLNHFINKENKNFKR